jgi:hypothetical protein
MKFTLPNPLIRSTKFPLADETAPINFRSNTNE